MFIVTKDFQVLKAGAATDWEVGHVENMIGFVVGQVNNEEVQGLVNGFGKAELACEKVDGAKAAISKTMAALGDVIVDVSGGEHGLAASADIGLVETAVHAALVIDQPSW